MSVALLAGCSGTPESERDLWDETLWHERLDRIVAEWPEPTSVQQEAIDHARERGFMPFEDYSLAVSRAIECIEAQGVEVDGPHTGGEVSGLPVLGYGYAVDSQSEEQRQQAQLIAQNCYENELGVIDVIYQTSPIATMSREEYAESYRDALMACLSGYGVAVDDDTPTGMLYTLTVDLDVATEGQQDCLQDVGYWD